MMAHGKTESRLTCAGQAAHLGADYSFGNAIFFICSAWFLIDNDKVSGRKILKMILDVWTISIIIAFFIFIMRNWNVSFKLLIRQFFPTTLSCNWYTTCYLLFYPVHGTLNKMMAGMTQKGLLC